MAVEKFLRKEGFSFTTITNDAINNIANPVALAVYVHLASKPETWRVRETEVCNHFNFKRTTWLKAMKYLREGGWSRMDVVRDGNGRLLGKEIVIVANRTELPKVGNTDSRSDSSVGETDPLVNKEGIRKERNIDCRCAPVREKKVYTEEFELWWKSYPKSADKMGGFKAWRRLTEKEKELATADVNTGRWHAKGKYAPNGSTYLNNKRWEDESESIESPYTIKTLPDGRKVMDGMEVL